MKRSLYIFLMAAALLAAYSCSKDERLDTEEQPISFGSYQARATKANTDGFADGSYLPDGSSFGVFGFFHSGTTSTPGSWNTSAQNHPNFMLNQKVTVSESSGTYTYDYTPARFWPAAGNRISFYAYYPYVANSSTYTASGVTDGSYAQYQLQTYMNKTTDGQGSFGFDVAYEAKDQIDFMISDLCADQNKKENILTSNSTTVQFDFHHVLAQVRIATLTVVNDNPDVTITPREIRFSGIAVHGECSVAENWGSKTSLGKVTNTFTWSNQITSRVGNNIEGVHVEYTGSKRTGETDAEYEIRKKQNYLMMIPQSFTDEATITIIYDVVRNNNSAGEHYSYTGNEVSAPLNTAKVGSTPLTGWEQNKIYNYTANISLTGIELTATYVDWGQGGQDLDLE